MYQEAWRMWVLNEHARLNFKIWAWMLGRGATMLFFNHNFDMNQVIEFVPEQTMNIIFMYL